MRLNIHAIKNYTSTDNKILYCDLLNKENYKTLKQGVDNICFANL